MTEKKKNYLRKQKNRQAKTTSKNKINLIPFQPTHFSK